MFKITLRKVLTYGACVLSFVLSSAAQAELTIRVKQNTFSPVPLVYQPLEGNTGLSKDLSAIIQNDLSNSGYIKVFSPPKDEHIDFKTRPQSLIQSLMLGQFLLVGQVNDEQEEHSSVDIRLWNLKSAEQMLGVRYYFNEVTLRRVAHQISNQVYKALTNVNGNFDTWIAFIDEEGDPLKRVRRLAIIDQDGFNVRYLTDGRHMVYKPQFSPDCKKIVYMVQDLGAQPSIEVMNLVDRKTQSFRIPEYMIVSPHFSPDSRSIVFSLQKGVNAAIVLLDLFTGSRTFLTQSNYIDTSPSFAPDGQSIVFESDRSGTQQLYTMNVDGTNVKRLTHGEGVYSQPIWSPRGDLIAFTHKVKGKFSIGVIRPDGTDERVLASGYHYESPSFSPNGQYVICYGSDNDDEGGQLHISDVNGLINKVLKTRAFASDPAWSHDLSNH